MPLRMCQSCVALDANKTLLSGLRMCREQPPHSFLEDHHNSMPSSPVGLLQGSSPQQQLCPQALDQQPGASKTKLTFGCTAARLLMESTMPLSRCASVTVNLRPPPSSLSPAGGASPPLGAAGSVCRGRKQGGGARTREQPAMIPC